MANWAVVIGINEYWNPNANLQGAVPDAVEMVRWLIDPKGGNVPARNLFLLTRPTPPPLPAGLTLPLLGARRDATKDDLIEVIDKLVDESEAEGERFFFCFSGHGIINHQNFTDEQALVMADFSPRRPDNAITLSSLREFFGNTGFAEQFFFIDGCRNMLDVDAEFRLGEFPFPGVPDAARLQNVSQYSLFATTPRLRAVELQERGAFTGLLLKGLRGAGRAKIYASESEEYLVTVDRLFTYVQEEMEQQKILVTEPPATPLYQKVYKELKGTGNDPVLVRLGRDEVAAERLELYVMPDGVWSSTDVKVRVTSEDTDYDKEVVPVKGVPVELPQPILPMTYTVRAEARGYTPERKRWAFDLYEPKRVEVVLRPDQSSSAVESARGGGDSATGDTDALGVPPGRSIQTDVEPLDGEEYPILLGGDDGWDVGVADGSSRSRGGAGRRGGDGSASQGGARKRQPKTATLTVESSDPLAPIEITDNRGALKAAGAGKAVASRLQPGFYRARLVTPEGPLAEEVLNLEAGDRETVSLDAPRLPNEGLFREIVDHTQFHTSTDGTLAVSEWVGAIATPQLATMLALAGCVADPHYGWSDKVLDVGLQPFHALVPGYESGLRVVLADELSSAGGAQGDFLSRVGLRFWPQAAPAPSRTDSPPASPVLSEKFSGLADYVRGAKPGAYVLELSTPDQPPVNFSVAVLPGRLTLLILHRPADGAPRVYAYSSPLTRLRYSPTEAARNLRRLELLQRFYMADKVNQQHTLLNAIELLHAKWIDPLAGCLGGYTMLKLGRANELARAVKNMLKTYGELSDSHVLAAEYHLSKRRSEQAAAAFRQALKLGLPVFAEGLLRLAGGIERFRIRSTRADHVREVLNKRVRQQLWTAWTIGEEGAQTAPGK